MYGYLVYMPMGKGKKGGRYICTHIQKSVMVYERKVTGPHSCTVSPLRVCHSHNCADPGRCKSSRHHPSLWKDSVLKILAGFFLLMSCFSWSVWRKILFFQLLSKRIVLLTDFPIILVNFYLNFFECKFHHIGNIPIFLHISLDNRMKGMLSISSLFIYLLLLDRNKNRLLIFFLDIFRH